MNEAILKINLLPNNFIIYFLLIHIFSLAIVYVLQIMNKKYWLLFIIYLAVTNLLFVIWLYTKMSFYLVGVIHSIFIIIEIYFYISKNYQLNLFIGWMFELWWAIIPFWLWIVSLIYLWFIF